MPVRSLLYTALLIVLLPGAARASALPQELPPLQDGDLVFQTLKSPQTLGVMAATHSLFTHVGLVHVQEEKYYVLDSAGSVGYSPLERWIENGQNEKFAVYRYKTLTSEEREKLFAHVEPYLNAPYDTLFVFGNKALYCSELPYLLFESIDKPIGAVEHLSDLEVDNPQTQHLMKQVWQQHPHCQATGETFESCYPKILRQEIVTPGSLARDTHMEVIFSNYGEGQ